MKWSWLPNRVDSTCRHNVDAIVLMNHIQQVIRWCILFLFNCFVWLKELIVTTVRCLNMFREATLLIKSHLQLQDVLDTDDRKLPMKWQWSFRYVYWNLQVGFHALIAVAEEQVASVPETYVPDSCMGIFPHLITYVIYINNRRVRTKSNCQTAHIVLIYDSVQPFF